MERRGVWACGNVSGCKRLRDVRYACVVYLFSALRSSLIEAEANDAEVFAVQDELSGVKLQLLIGS